MKLRSAVCLVLIGSICGPIARATSLEHKDLADPSKESAQTNSRVNNSLGKLPYKNLSETSKWSKLTNGKTLTAKLRKRSHALVQDDDPDALFTLGAGGNGCNWSCCFKTCVGSFVKPVSEGCITACGACFLTGSLWGCAICASCGLVSAAVVEFCGLRCCVDPGC